MQRSNEFPFEFDRERQRQRQAEIALKNKRMGINLFQISWIMAFVCLSVVNLVMRGNAPSWPPLGTPPLEPVLPTFATLGLIASMVLARRALVAIQTDKRTAFLVQWRAVLGLGALFVAVMIYEWITLTPTLSGPPNQFNTIFRLMTAFHSLHAIAIGVYLVWVLRRAAQGAYSRADFWEIEAGAKLWYFVVIAWLLFYAVLYII